MSPGENKGSGMRRWVLLALGLALVVFVYAAWQQSDTGEDEDAAPATAQEERAPANEGPEPAPEEQAPPPPDTENSARETADSPDAAEAGDGPAHEILAEMRETWACYEAADCTLGEDTDPRAEYFEADKRLGAGMQSLIDQHRAHRIGDAELADAAHEVLGYDSGRARAAAIEALGELPPADEHLEALVTTLDQHHDEKLFEIALPELQRYAEQGRREDVDTFLQSNLRSGAHFAARTIARELEPFLTPENVDEYRKLAEDLPEDDRRTALLRESLNAYEAD